MGILWLRKALVNLNEIAEYIAKDNPLAASQTVERIVTAVENLSSQPSMGRSGRVAGTRELVVSGTPFIVPYRVKDRTVQILRVFHASRRWPAAF